MLDSRHEQLSTEAKRIVGLLEENFGHTRNDVDNRQYVDAQGRTWLVRPYWINHEVYDLSLSYSQDLSLGSFVLRATQNIGASFNSSYSVLHPNFSIVPWLGLATVTQGEAGEEVNRLTSQMEALVPIEIEGFTIPAVHIKDFDHDDVIAKWANLVPHILEASTPIALSSSVG